MKKEYRKVLLFLWACTTKNKNTPTIWSGCCAIETVD